MPPALSRLGHKEKTDVICYKVPVLQNEYGHTGIHMALTKWQIIINAEDLCRNIVAAFWGMHVSPAKHSYAWLPRKCDYRTDRHTHADAGQSDPYVPLYFAGNTKSILNTNAHSFPWEPFVWEISKDLKSDQNWVQHFKLCKLVFFNRLSIMCLWNTDAPDGMKV